GKLAGTSGGGRLGGGERKGRVGGVVRGKAYSYAPVISREKAASQAVSDLIDRLFGGSVEGLVMSLVKTRKLDAKRIQELSELVDTQLTAVREGDRERD